MDSRGGPPHRKRPKRDENESRTTRADSGLIIQVRESDGAGSGVSCDGSKYSRKREAMQKYRFDQYLNADAKKLTVYQYSENILEMVRRNHVVIIEGFTGCGKTTQVPQFLLDAHIKEGIACNIVVTQPRRIAAQSVAKQVCRDRGWTIGTVVGYQVGLDIQVSQAETMITYMTAGVLLHKLIQSRSLRKFSHIIIDEVHERDLETDFLMLVIKKILTENISGQESHVKIILMSATMNAPKFSKYFTFRTSEGDVAAEAPIVKIGTAQGNYRVDEVFLDALMQEGEMSALEFQTHRPFIHNDVYETAVDTISGLDTSEREQAFKSTSDPRMRSQRYNAENRGSVLVFLPGIGEIQTMMKKLQDKNRDVIQESRGMKDSKWTIIPLHSSISADEQALAFGPVVDGSRKIILSTNIAESSITVPDVIYVIDFCLTKSMTVDRRTNFSCLRLSWASIAQCTQRKGRTGRVGPGKVFRLVPLNFYQTLNKDTCPEMLNSGLEGVILRVKKFQMGSPLEIIGLAIDAPPEAGIMRAIVNLKEVGALTMLMSKADGSVVCDPHDGEMTFLGKVMSQLPVSYQCARLIVLGHIFGVMKECIVIAAGLSVKCPFYSPFQQRLESYLSKMNWDKNSYSDCLSILNLYQEWMSKFGNRDDASLGERVWASSSLVQLNSLREIKALILDLEIRIKDLGVRPVPLFLANGPVESMTPEQTVMLKVAIAGAFYPNYFHRRRPENDYQREINREASGQDLLSTVYYRGFPCDRKGVLYMKHVAEKLTLGYDVPTIRLDGQKVLATFNSAGGKVGPINKAVYRAVKLRHLHDNLNFNIICNSDHEEAYAAHLERMRDDTGEDYIPCPEHIGLPGIGISEFFFVMTHVETLSQFWVIPSAKEKRWREMQVLIQDGMIDRLFSYINVVPGALCLAPYTDGTSDVAYFRARIRAVETQAVLVYFIDYGNSARASRSSLRPFSQQHIEGGLTTERCLAMECRLSLVKPSTLNGSVWHPEALGKFSRLLSDPNYCAKIGIYAVCKRVIYGTVYVMKRDGGVEPIPTLNINDRLVKEGYADRVAENMECHRNNEARMNFHHIRGDSHQVDFFNRIQQEGSDGDISYVEPPDREDGADRIVELKGPWSPLEMGFVSICHSSSSMQVSVDEGSVNSVALDQEPSAPTSRFLVSAFVGIQDRGNRVMARDTTMMPAIPGLMAFMAMVFAPKIELHLDKFKNRYAGVLCGLGVSPDPSGNIVPAYQDHDAEIVFDTEISDADISAINSIRCHMNHILRAPGSNPASHKQVVGKMFALLKKTRKRIEETWQPDATLFKWGRVDRAQVIPPDAEFVYEQGDIFSMHSTIQLALELDPDVVNWGNWAV